MSKPFCKYCGLNDLDFWCLLTGYLAWFLGAVAVLVFVGRYVFDHISVSISLV
jgi:hypothetical protein